MEGENLLEGKRILIVDDEPDVLSTLEELLSMCDVQKASTFDEAREKLESRYFDIAILDIMGVDGYNLLKIANKRDVIAVMLTAHALSSDNMVKSYREGAVSFVPKEKMAELPSLLNDILEHVEEGKDFLWSLWLKQLDSYLEKKFGPDWKDKEKEFWEKLRSKP